jgi:Ca2+-binding EF-hand superfamily protein
MKKLLITGLLVAVSGAVIAESPKLFILDADKDGLISVEEAKLDSDLSEAFTTLDINQDGYLSELEMNVKVD